VGIDKVHAKEIGDNPTVVTQHLWRALHDPALASVRRVEDGA
jgi:hypothetical protein